MHAFLEADMGEKPALRPKAAIGPAVRAIAGAILADARAAISDPERSSAGRRARVPPRHEAMARADAPARAVRRRTPGAGASEARDHARSLALARDGQSALNALDDLVNNGLALSERSVATHPRPASKRCAPARSARCSRRSCARRSSAGSMRRRRRSRRGRSIRSIHADRRAASPPATAPRAGAIAGRLVAGAAPRNCTSCAGAWSTTAIRWIWSSRCGRASAACGPRKPNGCATGSAACQDLEVLERLAGPHQPLAHWRSRLTPAMRRTHDRAVAAAPPASPTRLFAERPKAFRQPAGNAVGDTPR